MVTTQTAPLITRLQLKISPAERCRDFSGHAGAFVNRSTTLGRCYKSIAANGSRVLRRIMMEALMCGYRRGICHHTRYTKGLISSKSKQLAEKESTSP